MRKSWPLFFLLLSACSLGQDYQKPALSMPEHWPWEAETLTPVPLTLPSQIQANWWKIFNDPALTRLIDEALNANQDLLTAAARVAEARSLYGLAEASQYPLLSAQASAERTSNSRESTFNNVRRPSKPFNAFSLTAVLDYEVDLWGKLRRATEAAQARLLATEANRDAIRLAVASDVAAGYFNLRAIDAQIGITDETIKSREEALRYQKAQYEQGSLNTLTYQQAEAELASARAILPELVQARQEQESALAILLGRTPKELAENPISRGKEISTLPAAPTLPASLPSALLSHRPDIAAAEQNLIAANADVAVAKADFFPTISLSALIGLTSSEADRLLRGSARNWGGGANLATPLLDFGRASAYNDSVLARKDQALLQYQKTVSNAFKDALDALSAIQTSAARVSAQTAQVQARSIALDQTQLRYNAGYSTYLEMLDAQRFLYQAQLDRATAERDRLVAFVNLYKSFGGGWQSRTLQDD